MSAMFNIFKLNIDGCLNKYYDIEGALKWFVRAEEELLYEEFISLVDLTIGSYSHEVRFTEIFSLREKKRISLFGMNEIEGVLKAFNFKSAEGLFLKYKDSLNQAESQRLVQNYNELVLRYQMHHKIDSLKTKIKKILPVKEPEAASLIMLFEKFEPALFDEFSLQRFEGFFRKNLSRLTFPPSIYVFMTEKAIAEIKSGAFDKNQEFLTELLIRTLPFFHAESKISRKIWELLCNDQSLLKTFSSFHKNFLDTISGAYPYENLFSLAPLYLPSEESCLNYLMKLQISLDRERYDQLKFIFETNRYFSCQFVLALKIANIECNNVLMNDILDLVREIIKKVFDYNLESKDPIANLIFPKCISDFKDKKISISHRNFVYCEGRLLERKDNKERYIFCRNRQCNERTKILNEGGQVETDSSFINFLDKEFRIVSNEIFSNKSFMHSMGAFNRWNEIAERLVCGYDGTIGCGSPLIFSNSPQVNPGFAAYATTYWRCSKQECKQAEIAVKISHCRGCRKIIDSRFDKISCEARKGHFLICMACGYCCDEHKVSGVCPQCGQENKWENLDQFGKRHRCLKCGHEIAVPGHQKGSLAGDSSKVDFDKWDFNFTD